MKVLAVNPQKPEPGVIAETAEYIRKGFAVIIPTDTVYGLAANGLDESAIERVFTIKKRPPSKAVPLLVKNMAMARKLAYISDAVQRRLEELWPGAVTAVLYKKDLVPASAAGGGETIALRISPHSVVRELIRAVDAPLTGTSAGISGLEPSGNLRAVLEQFKHAPVKPDLVLDAGVLPAPEPSTVLDLTREKPQLLRVGPATKRELDKLWRG